MYQRQRNTRSHTAQIPETRDPGGVLLPAADVEADGEIDWPYPLSGFEGWIEPAVGSATAPQPSSAKTRTKADKTAADTPEGTP